MKRQEIAIVTIVRAAFAVVECRTADERDVVATVELPIHILEAVVDKFGMVQQDRHDFPMP